MLDFISGKENWKYLDEFLDESSKRKTERETKFLEQSKQDNAERQKKKFSKKKDENHSFHLKATHGQHFFMSKIFGVCQKEKSRIPMNLLDNPEVVLDWITDIVGQQLDFLSDSNSFKNYHLVYNNLY